MGLFNFKKGTPPAPSPAVMRDATRMVLGEGFAVELERHETPSPAAWLNQAANQNLWMPDYSLIAPIIRRAGDLAEGGLEREVGSVYERLLEVEEQESPAREQLSEVHGDVTRLLQALMVWAALNLSAGFPEWTRQRGYYMGPEAVMTEPLLIFFAALRDTHVGNGLHDAVRPRSS